MENKISIIALITVFYIFGLCAFYGECHAVFACLIAAVLVLLVFCTKLKPLLCIVLNFIFIFGFLNAKLHNKEFDSLSSIDSVNNAVLKGRVFSIPNAVKEKRTAKFILDSYGAKIFDEDIDLSDTKVLVSIQDDKEKYKSIKIGDIIEIEGNLRKPAEPSNPGKFNYKKYLQNKDVFVILYSNNKNFKILSHPDIFGAENKFKELWWCALQGLDNARDTIILKHGKYIKSPNLEVLGGIVFGDDAVNPPDTVKQSFINSGLLHLLAASGLNVALIFGIWWALSGFLNFSYKVRLMAGMGIVLFYTFMTGFPPSILRASIMLIIILAGKLMFKAADNITLIFFTAFIMLLFNPKLLNDVGFELSFLVTGGLMTCIQPLCLKFKNADKAYKKRVFKIVSSYFAPNFAGSKFITGFLFIFSPVSFASMLLVPLTAQIWAAPLQMYYFNTFTPYSVFANIAVLPFIGVISFAGFISSVAAFLPLLGGFVIKISSFILNPLITALLFVSDFFSKLPYAVIKMPSGQVFQIVIYYIVILCFISCISDSFKNKKRNSILIVLAVFFFGSICFSACRQIFNNDFEITAFSVGNADNFLIKTPKNKYIMIDAAKLPYRGVSGAKRVTLEYMYDKNIRELEYLIITHFDSDHSGGTIDILKNINVKNVIVQRETCDSLNSCSIFDFMKTNNVIYRKALNNEIIYKEEDFEIKTLLPDNPKIKKEDDNENSVIALADYKGSTALFMGDGGIKAFRAVKKYIPQKIKILKAGHHGAKDVVDKDMLEYLKPEYSIISTGINHYGHPHIETLKMLENSGSKIYSTKDNGAIKFVFKKDGTVKIYTFFGKKKKDKF